MARRKRIYGRRRKRRTNHTSVPVVEGSKAERRLQREERRELKRTLKDDRKQLKRMGGDLERQEKFKADKAAYEAKKNSPNKFLGVIGGALSLAKKARNRKKGSAEATGRAEGAASGEMRSAGSMRMGGLMGMKADMFNRGSMKGGLRGMVERVVDEKLEGGSKSPEENQEKTLKTPKNDATTKELTTSSKDASIAEGVTRLYKQ
jgi:hypothetical protein